MRSRLQQRLLTDFVAWAQERELVADGTGGEQGRDRIAVLLDGRAEFLAKPDPSRWRSGDVHELFMDHLVSRQVDDWDLTGEAVDTMRSYLRFLDETKALHPASTRVPTLLAELDRLAPKFPAAMADTSRWRLAKRVFTASRADGVPIGSDRDGLNAWAERFNALDWAGRRAILGELLDQNPRYGTGRLLIHDGQVAIVKGAADVRKHDVWPDCDCDCGCPRPGSFPPVTLPSRKDLAQDIIVRGAGVLRQLDALARWVGADGQAVDKEGALARADQLEAAAVVGLPAPMGRSRQIPALSDLWSLAVDFDVVRLRRRRVVRGDGAGLISDALAGRAEPGPVLDFWCELADAFIQPRPPEKPPAGLENLHEWLQPWAPRLLGVLYSRLSGGPIDVDAAVDDLLEEYAQRLPRTESGLFAGLVTAHLRRVLSALDQHGAVGVTVTEPTPRTARQQAAAALVGVADWALLDDPVVVELTDLGRYLVRERLLAERADAPLAG